MSVIDAEANHEISYMRQRGWFDPQEHQSAHVTLVGVGGIGSPLALALAKLGIPKLSLIDPDTVERHNLPNQMFMGNAVGESKVEAVKEVIFATSPATRVTRNKETLEEFSGRLSGVVCSGLDSMEARSALWEKVKYKPRIERYFDGRLAGEHIIVLSVNPNNPDEIKRYEEEALYYGDGDALEAPCTMQSVIDVGFAVASLMTRGVRRHYAGAESEFRVWLDMANLTITKEV